MWGVNFPEDASQREEASAASNMFAIKLKRLIFHILKKTPADMPMVEYWKTKDSVQAKLMTGKDGSTVMQMDGEKHVFPGFPRGHILYGRLSKLKHEIKNQIFNDSWANLENGATAELIVRNIETIALPNIFKLFEESKYDLMPTSRMAAPVREIHRAWTAIATTEMSRTLRDIFCHIIQEDDAYRFRVQWAAQFFKPRPWADNLQRFEQAMKFTEDAEVIGDMKERQRLWRRIFLVWLGHNRAQFEAFVKEVDWKKVRMSEADKYFFRGKWFKVDLDKFEY